MFQSHLVMSQTTVSNVRYIQDQGRRLFRKPLQHAMQAAEPAGRIDLPVDAAAPLPLEPVLLFSAADVFNHVSVEE